MYSDEQPGDERRDRPRQPAEGLHRAAGPVDGAGEVHDAGDQAEQESAARRRRRDSGRRVRSIRRAPHRADERDERDRAVAVRGKREREQRARERERDGRR